MKGAEALRPKRLCALGDDRNGRNRYMHALFGLALCVLDSMVVLLLIFVGDEERASARLRSPLLGLCRLRPRRTALASILQRDGLTEYN